MPITPLNQRPGVGAAQTASHANVFRNGESVYMYPAGGTLDGANARDPGNPDTPLVLRPGLMLGQVGATRKWANSFPGGPLQAALGGGGTTLSLLPAFAAELLRRVGGSGAVTVTGPAYPGGPARQLTAAFTAVNPLAGAVTISADAVASGAGQNAVQTLAFTDGGSGAGTFTLTVEGVTTPAVTYSGTAATLVANLNAALTAVLGASQVVASGSAVTGLPLTYSGPGYARRPAPLVTVNPSGLTGVTVAAANTTPGVAPAAGDSGEFTAGSLVGAADGSQVPLTVVPDGYGLTVQGDGTDRDFPHIPYAGVIESQLMPEWPADPGLRAWVRAALNCPGGPKFVFGDLLNPG